MAGRRTGWELAKAAGPEDLTISPHRFRVWFATQPVAGHERILAAVKRHAPDDAQRAMLEHINTVIADVRKYHGQSRKKGDPPG